MMKADTMGIKTDSLFLAVKAACPSHTHRPRSGQLIARSRLVWPDWFGPTGLTSVDAIIGIQIGQASTTTNTAGHGKTPVFGTSISMKFRPADTLAMREKQFAPLKIAAIVRELSERGYSADRAL